MAKGDNMEKEEAMNKIYIAYGFLQQIHNYIMNVEPLPEHMKTESMQLIEELSEIKTEDQETNEIISNVIDTMIEQLELCDKIKEQKEKLWDEFKEKFSSIENEI